jgi:hypothetical protein
MRIRYWDLWRLAVSHTRCATTVRRVETRYKMSAYRGNFRADHTDLPPRLPGLARDNPIIFSNEEADRGGTFSGSEGRVALQDPGEAVGQIVCSVIWLCTRAIRHK